MLPTSSVNALTPPAPLVQTWCLLLRSQQTCERDAFKQVRQYAGGS